MTNFADKTIWTGDNLDILRGMNSESVDLIYLDPPFNSNRNYAAFQDTWHLSDLDVAWMGLIADEEPAVYKVLEALLGPLTGRGCSPTCGGKTPSTVLVDDMWPSEYACRKC